MQPEFKQKAFESFTLQKFHVFFARLFFVVPVTILFISYYFDNWWLLFGVAFYFVSAFFTPSLIAMATLFCIGFWVAKGFDIHEYVTLFYFCLLVGFLVSKISMQYKKQSDNLQAELYKITEAEVDKEIKERYSDLN